MPSLEVHIRADKSGPEPAPGEAWPLSHVELSTPLDEVPEQWGFSSQYVDKAVELGWMQWAGDPMDHDVEPDPGGQFKQMGKQTLHFPGDRLVLKLKSPADGSDIELVYRVTDPPEPHGFRDAKDGTATHDYTVELVK